MTSDETTRADALNAFLVQSLGRPFAWGRCDCALWCCDWIAERRGIDPAAGLRGAYDTAEACQALLSGAGGLRAVAGRLFAAAGLAEVAAPQLGDVGLLKTLVGPTLVLWSGDRWAWKTLGGVAFLPARAAAVWRVEGAHDDASIVAGDP